MASINSRNKGKRGELEWAHYCQEHYGLDQARRSQQYCAVAGDADVQTFPGTHCECKRVERLNVQEAMDQAMRDCRGTIPYVAHRKNRGGWMVTVPAELLIEFCRLVLSAERKPTLDGPPSSR